jgi:hypothetical protein
MKKFYFSNPHLGGGITAGSNHLRYVQQHGLYELILGTKKGVRSEISKIPYWGTLHIAV